ncbi:MAG: Crp/Fnr family transcriptional regulator [Spirochaetales bacterium]|nr:Crp/Fnr family transcriptional regulator [Spirochaetales bacterium]
MTISDSLLKRFGKIFKDQDIIFCEFEPGETFYLIHSGKVQIVKIMGDIEKTVDVLEPGEIFGEMAILEGAPRSATAIALHKVVALEFNRENFKILMQGNPQIALKLLKLFTKRIYDQKRRFMILTLEEIEAKVADVFLMLAEKEPARPEETEEVELHASIDDIAHWAGLPPNECRKVIEHFQRQQRINVIENKIIVHNINDFSRYVSSKRKQLKNE